MAISKAQQAAVKRYNDNHYDRIEVKVPKGMKATILEHAARKGETMNGYVKRAIEEAISRENAE